MGEVINLRTCKGKEYVLKTNSKSAEALGLNHISKCILSYGTRRCFSDVKVSDDVEENGIMLSERAAHYLYLPDYPDFEMRIDGVEVSIGPHIGIIISKKDDEITEARLKAALKFIPQYSSLHGSVIVFAVDKVDMSNRLIEGYCYNPKSPGFVRGVYPYPLSIYLRVALDYGMKNHFLSSVGNTVFNNFYLNKYDLYNWLSSDQSIVQHLPYTVLYRFVSDVEDMLKRFGKVYVKPIYGEKGIGVVKISLEDNRAAVRYRENMNNMERLFENFNQCSEYIMGLLTPGRYIVQQSVDILTYEGRVTDFRLIIQKDIHGCFICKGIVALIGASGSIVSNFYSGGELVWGAELLRKALNFQDAEIAAMEEKISSFGLKVCNTLEKKGIKYGNLGIDIGIDINGRLWLIEINSRSPDPRAALLVNDMELYRDIQSAPLFYAKFLAGFGQ